MSPVRLNLRSSIDVPQSPHDVWTFLSVPTNSPLWDRSVAKVEPLNDGPVGVGWEGLTTAPSGMQQRFRITRWEPERSFAFDLLESSMFRDAVLIFDVNPHGSGTEVVHEIRMQLRNVFLYPVLRVTARRALGRDMQSLADALERSAPTGE
jgi:hypothetical protein